MACTPPRAQVCPCSSDSGSSRGGVPASRGPAAELPGPLPSLLSLARGRVLSHMLLFMWFCPEFATFLRGLSFPCLQRWCLTRGTQVPSKSEGEEGPVCKGGRARPRIHGYLVPLWLLAPLRPLSPALPCLLGGVARMSYLKTIVINLEICMRKSRRQNLKGCVIRRAGIVIFGEQAPKTKQCPSGVVLPCPCTDLLH